MIYTNNKMFISGLGFCSSLAIASFAAIRLTEANYPLFILDSILAIIFFSLSFYSYKTGKLYFARHSAAIFASLGAITTTYISTNTGLFWVYVATMAMFYLLHHSTAVLFSMVTLAAAGWILSYEQTLIEMMPFIATVCLVCAFTYLFASNSNKMSTTLTKLSLQDDLTGIHNRRAFGEQVLHSIELFHRLSVNASLIYIDVDGFKQINDQHGHEKGDFILVEVSRILQSNLRRTDHLFRLGGDEFVIIADGANQIDASVLANKLRKKVEFDLQDSESNLTISVGVAQLNKDDTDTSWIARADKALYVAKEAGRNRVEEAPTNSADLTSSAYH